MKKKLFVSLTALLAFALTACNIGPSSEEKKEDKKESEVASEVVSENVSSNEAQSSSEHKHSYGEWTRVTEPTCTEKGSEERVCECGEKQTRSVNALGHSWGEWTINQPIPCEAGSKTRSCTVCGAVETQVVEAGEHTFGELQITKPATCGEGLAKHVCSGCNKEESVVILPTEDHTWAAATVEHEAATGEVTETYESCAACEQMKIAWNAQDANKQASSGFNSSGKFNAAGDYVIYKFYAPKALKARLWVKIANRSGSSDSPYKRAEKTGNQSIWYDYYNGPEFKYTVTVNEAVIDQNAQADVLIGEEVVPMSEYMYSDFLPEGANELVAPWFTFDVSEGLNTLKIERTLGYSVSVKEFYVIGA